MGNLAKCAGPAVAALLAVSLAACPPPVKKPTGGTTVTVTGGSDDLPGNFHPGDPLPDPLPPDPKAYGLSYLEQVGAALHEGWSTFLEDARTRLPPDDKLNSPTLEVTLQLTIDANGALTQVDRLQGSGVEDFDATAEEVVHESAPFPAPPRELLSDDGHAYVTWLFARDRRQAGVATASLHREEWPIDRAVPKFIGDGNLAEAARRLDAAGAGDPAGAVTLAVRVAAAALREGLLAQDLAVQKLAAERVEAVAVGGDKEVREALAPAAHELRAIATGSLEIEVRAAAIRALGALHDTDSVDTLSGILDKDAGHNAALSAAAAAALIDLDAGHVAKTLRDWLGSGDRGKLGGALAILGDATVPGLTDDVTAHIADKDLGVRVAACHALGRVAPKDAPGWKGLRKGLDDRDASVRAACAEAIAAVVAGGGGGNKTAYWRLVALFKDRDDHVRAAAVTAAAWLQPSKVSEELAPYAHEKSATVLAALATALGQVKGGEDPPRRLVALAGDPDASVRLAAVTALAARGGKGAAVAAKAVVDPDRTVRLAALAAVTDPAALETLAGDADAEVAAGAGEARITRLGRQKALAIFLGVVENAPEGSAARVRAAAAWLQAH